MDERDRTDLAELLRARLAAAGLTAPPEDTPRLERDLALHLERIAALTKAADLSPADPPLTDPARAASGSGTVGPGGSGAPPGAVDNRRPAPGGSATLPEGAPSPAGEAPARPEASASITAGEGPARPQVGAPTAAGRVGVRPVGLVEQACLLRDGEATSVELVGRALDRIEALDGRVGAFVVVLAEEAMAEAGERDRERRQGEPAGRLHGVPVAVKDLVDVAGVVTGAGSPKLARNLAAADAEVVARLRAAGAVVVGKTRTHEFAYGVVTPGTVNPWDPERIAGGSSGGSAAAVAAGLVPAAVGTDTAGSIRIPSACCGVVGLKPTWGRVPATGVWPLSWSCDHVGPIAGDVADVALLDRVLAGDPDQPGPDPTPAAAPRIGRLVGEDLEPVDPAVTAVVDELCARLAAAGARIDEVTLPLAAARGAVAAIVLAEAAAAHARLLAETGEDGYSRAMLSMLRIGGSALAGEYLAGLRYRARFAARVEGLLAARDALLLPTLPCVAPRVDQRTVTIGGAEVGVQAALTRLPGPFNCSGSPVLSLPAGRARPTGAPPRGSPDPSGHLPVGVSLVGRIGGDRDLLNLAAWVEAAAPPVGRPADLP